MNELSFVQGWYARGKQESDIVFKFVSYFIAFNFLYNERNDNPESERVMQYAENKIKQLYITEDIFHLLSSESEFFKDGYHSCRRDSIIPKLNSRQSNISDLFYAIYKIRCNLFHGSKTMESKRDKGLVADATKVLDDFIGKWIKANGGEYDG